MADDEEKPAPEQGLDGRVSSLETGQETLTQKIDKLLGIVGADGPGDGQDGHDGEGTGTNIAHEIRAQIDARDAKKAEEDRQAGLHSTVDELKTKVTELAEKPPAPMPRRIEKLMGWS